MRWLVLLIFVVACKGDSQKPATGVRERTAAARTDAFRALTDGLNEAFTTLRDQPGDRAGALAKARRAIEPFYKADAATFELHVGDGVWMLHAPGTGVWLARDDKQLLTEVAQLPASAQAVIGVKPEAGDELAQARTRGAALIGELKKSLVGAVTKAMGQGLPAAIATCHSEAPTLTAAVAREGATIGRATRRPRNPKNEATGWQADALTHFEQLAAASKPLAGQSFARTLDGGRVAYAEPLVIQELCLACHGGTLAPEVKTALAEKYPDDRATGYALGDLRGVAWVELPAAN